MLNQEVKELVYKTGQLIDDRMVETAIANGSEASGRLIRSISALNKENQEEVFTIISTVDYAKYVDEGRRPGEMPPIQDILNWIQEKPIRPRGITQESLAWAIAKTIARKGIKPRPFIQKSINEVMLGFQEKLVVAGEIDITNYFDRQIEQNTDFKVK